MKVIISCIALGLSLSGFSLPSLGFELTQRSPSAKTEAASVASSDINIRERNSRVIKSGVIFPSSNPPNTKIIYEVDWSGQGCVLGCDKINGIVAKWSDFFVELQPYKKECLFICHNDYPFPAREVTLKTGGGDFILKMTNEDKVQYYIPLSARKALASTMPISILIPGAPKSTYSVGQKNREKIASLVNTSLELVEYITNEKALKSKEERLAELSKLRSAGLIEESEYKQAREKILAD